MTWGQHMRTDEPCQEGIIATADLQELDELLKEACYYPDSDDMTYLQLLLPSAMRSLILRLRGLHSLRNGSSIDVSSAIAGISVPSMYRLNAQWRDRQPGVLRRITGMGGRPPRGKGRTTNKARDQAETAARRIMRESPDLVATPQQLGRVLADRFDIGVTTGRLIAIQATLEERRRPEDLRDTYARSVGMDFLATGLSLCGDVEESGVKACVVAMLTEQRSGLILSMRRIDATTTPGILAELASDALRFLKQHRADVSAEYPCEMVAVMPPAWSEYPNTWWKLLQIPEKSVMPWQTGRKRFGRLSTSFLGTQIGNLNLYPEAMPGHLSKAATKTRFGKQPISTSLADTLISNAQHEHNAHILTLLRKAEIIGDPSSEYQPGIMDTVLTAVASALQTNADEEDRGI